MKVYVLVAFNQFTRNLKNNKVLKYSCKDITSSQSSHTAIYIVFDSKWFYYSTFSCKIEVGFGR